MDIFYASTTITTSNDNIAAFRDSPWLNGQKLKDIAPHIFYTSSWKSGRLSKLYKEVHDLQISN
jgi:hypothetical protein